MEELIQTVEELVKLYKYTYIFESDELNSDFKSKMLEKLENALASSDDKKPISDMYNKSAAVAGYKSYEDFANSPASKNLKKEPILLNEILNEISSVKKHNKVEAAVYEQGGVISQEAQARQQPAAKKEKPKEDLPNEGVSEAKSLWQGLEKYVEKTKETLKEVYTNNGQSQSVQSVQPNNSVYTKQDGNTNISNISSNSPTSKEESNFIKNEAISKIDNQTYSTDARTTNNVYETNNLVNSSDNRNNNSALYTHNNTFNKHDTSSNIDNRSSVLSTSTSNNSAAHVYNDSKNTSSSAESVNNQSYKTDNNVFSTNTVSNANTIKNAIDNSTHDSDVVNSSRHDNIISSDSAPRASAAMSVIDKSGDAIPKDITVTLKSEASIEKLVSKLDSMPHIIAASVRDAIIESMGGIMSAGRAQTDTGVKYQQPYIPPTVNKSYRS